MSRKHKLPRSTSFIKNKLARVEDEESSETDEIPREEIQICNDTEAAILLIKNILSSKNKSNPFPPVVFVHQIFNIIENRATVNRQIECLRNDKKILLIHMGADENMKVVVSYDDLKNHLLESEEDKSKIMVYEKFFNEVLPNTTDIGISKVDLLIKYRFSEIGVRTLVNAGLLILRETGIFWFSFPSAGAFMKKVLKGRQTVLKIIKKRKHREILQNELEKRKLDKSLDLPLLYFIHDLVGSNVLKCMKTTSGPLLRFVKN